MVAISRGILERGSRWTVEIKRQWAMDTNRYFVRDALDKVDVDILRTRFTQSSDKLFLDRCVLYAAKAQPCPV